MILFIWSQLKYKTVPQQEIQPGSTVKVAVHLNQLQDKENKKYPSDKINKRSFLFKILTCRMWVNTLMTSRGLLGDSSIFEARWSELEDECINIIKLDDSN